MFYVLGRVVPDPKIDPPVSPLTLTAIQNNSYIKLNKTGNPVVNGLQYRRNESDEWQPYDIGTQISLSNSGDYVQFQNIEDELSNGDYDYVKFEMSGKIKASGNIQSMLNYSDSCIYGCYTKLFENCTSLVEIPDLSEIKVYNDYAFSKTFNNTGLTKIELNLNGDLNYSEIFYRTFENCNNVLSTIINIDTNKIGSYCFDETFSRCNVGILSGTINANIARMYAFQNTFANYEDDEEQAEKYKLRDASNLQFKLNKIGFAGFYNMFKNRQTLQTAPEFDHFLIIDPCSFYGIFENCDNLINPPTKLPWDKIPDYCFSRMFYNCNKLNKTPQIHANTLLHESRYYFDSDDYAEWEESGMFPYEDIHQDEFGNYYANVVHGSQMESMFQNCTALTTIPVLSAVNISTNCYSNMFKRCETLTGGLDVLPATKIGDYSYSSMFRECYALKTAPKILVNDYLDIPYYDYETDSIKYRKSINCFDYMFCDCSVLTGGVTDLYLNEITDYCYSNMFKNCKKLINAPNLHGTIVNTESYLSMFENCNSLLSIPDFDIIELKGTSCCDSMFRYCTSLTGGITHLSAPNLTKSCYASMFNQCTTLITAPKIDATGYAQENSCRNMFSSCIALTGGVTDLYIDELNKSCYYHMFDRCTSLITAPKIHATKGFDSNSCCSNMFLYCSSLTGGVDILSGSIMGDHCCDYMFANCTSLTQTPQLPATKLLEACYEHMFENCTSLINAPELPATELQNGNHYNNMFSNCTSLINGSTIKANNMGEYSCFEMFKDCISLTNIPNLSAMILANSCYEGMFRGCTTLIQAPKLYATALANSCYKNMFSSCIALTTAPELVAPILVNDCYYEMFENCNSLNYINVNFTEWNPSNATRYWLNNISTTGTFVCHNELSDIRDVHHIPIDWTRVNK